MTRAMTLPLQATSIMSSLIVLLFVWMCPAGAQVDDAVKFPSFPMFHRQHASDSGRRRLQAGDGEYVDRYETHGVHFIDLYVGKPAQMQTLSIQTGSEYTAFACEDCKDCGDRGADKFNHSLSSEFATVTCDQCMKNAATTCQDDRCIVSYDFRDLSSWRGYEVTDTVYLNGDDLTGASSQGADAASANGFSLQFVCQTRTRGYYAQAQQVKDGVLGISPKSTSFVQQMHAAGKLSHPRISLCFNNNIAQNYPETGVVTFGGFNPAFSTTEMVYAKNVAKDSYRLNIRKVYLRIGGGNSVLSEPDQQSVELTLPKSIDLGAAVDSGIPYLTFDERMEDSFRKAWFQATGSDFSYARQTLTEAQLVALPTILIELEGDGGVHEIDPDSVPNLTSDYNILIAVPAIHYMEEKSTTYRARIQFDGQDGSFLGANAMRGHNIVFEIDKNRIGFAEARQCQAKAEETGSTGIVSGTPVESGTNSGENVKNTVVTISADDDMFVPGGSAADGGTMVEDDIGGGGCTTATCRCFLAVGYVLVGTALAVAYRVSRPKEQTPASADPGNMYKPNPETLQPFVGYSEEDKRPAYRRKAWSDEGTIV